MAEKQRIDEPTGTETVGHEWDGIEELNTPLPRWWLITLYATIVWAIGYAVLFPAIPLLDHASAGWLGWSSRGEFDREAAAENARRAPLLKAIGEAPLTSLTKDGRLRSVAVEGGRAAFKVNCVQCHGSGAQGSRGFPNLNDDDWLWGGDIAAIHYTIENGIRNPDHPTTRMSQMPAFDGALSAPEIRSLVAFVQTISHQRKADAFSGKGSGLYATNCAFCHGPDGRGGRQVGAPNLTDAIWLYGGDSATLAQTIRFSRQGVMPRWGAKLDPVTVKMLAVYVHSLGGGEAPPAPAAVNGEPR